MANKATKENTAKVVTAYARGLHIAPRKMRLVTNLVKGTYALDAIVQLQHSTKKAAPMVIKLLKSAIANAQHNFSMEPDGLYIKSITADMGKVMKRYFPRARGSAFVIRRKMAHVNVVLEERKRKKAANPARTALLNRLNLGKKDKEEKQEPKAAETKGTNVEQKTEAKRTAPRSSEQVKENKIQNKRRLFNRKAGV